MKLQFEIKQATILERKWQSFATKNSTPQNGETGGYIQESPMERGLGFRKDPEARFWPHIFNPYPYVDIPSGSQPYDTILSQFHVSLPNQIASNRHGGGFMTPSDNVSDGFQKDSQYEVICGQVRGKNVGAG